MSTPPGEREQQRVDALRRYGIIDTEPEALYDDIAMLAARMCGTKYAAVSFVDDVRCWYKAVWGMTATTVDRTSWFCDEAVGAVDDVTVIADTHASKKYAAFPMVAGEPHLRFYAGAPIVSGDGFVVGTVCVFDTEPRELLRDEVLALQVLSRQVMSLLDLRHSTALLEMASIKMQMLVDRDTVTGLPSERMFRTQLRTEFQYARRHNQPLSLVLLDIDGFAKINELYGAVRGDDILKLVARTVSRDTRDYDLTARSGSDEFAIVMRNAGSATGLSVAQRIRNRIASADGARESIMVSIGVATISPEMIGSREMIERARAGVSEFRRSEQLAAA